MPCINATEEANSLPFDAEKKQFLQHDTKILDDLFKNTS